MKVLKFGGTSVGSPQRISEVADLVAARGHNIIVLSAMSGTTNSLVEISDYYAKGNYAGAAEIINRLEQKYREVIATLFKDHPDTSLEAQRRVNAIFATLRSFTTVPFTDAVEKEILAQGELISTNLMTLHLQDRGLKVALLPALDFMLTDANAEPDYEFIREQLQKQLEANADRDLYITQGFICRNHKGEIDNLQRGGSDYTASIIGAVCNAEEIQIWTDIDGMHNNDPRFVEGTRPVHTLHFEEAAELAYFGAKILHPTCVLPAKLAGIPVRLLNTMQPSAEGTLIYNAPADHTIKSVAAKDNITAIKIKSGRMLLAYGFLRKVFEIFETYRTPIDMVVTSEVGVSVTVDNKEMLSAITDELRKFGTVTVDEDMVIICVVGDLQWQNRGFEAEVVNALRDIPVRMISYGGSNYNISLLIRRQDKERALNLLSRHLFD